MRSFLLCAAAVLLLVDESDAFLQPTVYYDWDLADVFDNTLAPDCLDIVTANRPLYLAEGSFPGPTIDVNEGDRVHVRIRNLNPTQSVTIHFHGIHQRGTQYSDGPAFVTQCGLGPSQSQEYVFDAYPPGTHFWHAHLSLHASDGLAGPIIVRPKKAEPFAYDAEAVMFLQDYYIKTGAKQHEGILAWPFVFIGNPQSLLINGKGLAPSCVTDPTPCIAGCGGDLLQQYRTTTVEEGKTYRLRIINSGQLVMMNFAIFGHSLSIVQLEGTNIQPVPADSVDLAPGQRVDVLFTANQAPGSYWIETKIRMRNIPTVMGKAILQYATAAATVPADSPSHPAWDDVAFGVLQSNSYKTLVINDYPEEKVALTATDIKRYVIVGTQNQVITDGAPTRLVWALNNVSNIVHDGTVAVLDKAVEASRAQGWPTVLENTVELPQNPPNPWNYLEPVWLPGNPGPAVGQVAESVVYFEKGDVFEFVMQNARALNNVTEMHPWHTHGHSCWVVGRGDGSWNEGAIASYNLVDPLLQDTFTLWPSQWVAVRCLANNPGVWLYHCHIPVHELMGMALHIVTQPNEVPIQDSQCENSLYERTYPLWISLGALWDTIVGFIGGIISFIFDLVWPF